MRPSISAPLGRAPAIALLLAAIFARLITSSVAHAEAAPPARTLDDYRHFRALSIDLVGRAPTRDEIAAFERPDFDQDRWIDAHLGGPGYVDRLSRVYMDLLRLEVGPAVTYAPPSATLHRVEALGPGGKPLFIYYRVGQRRGRDATDGEFCLTEEESGLRYPSPNNVSGTPKRLSQEVLDAHTVLVRPWWLYRDYLAPHPSLRWRDGWSDPDPLFVPIDELLAEPDHTPTLEVRVCREEARTAETGSYYITNRKAPERGTDPPEHRVRPLPLDDGYAAKHPGEPLPCRSALAPTLSLDCGCGPGLVWCMPGDSTANDPRAFSLPTRTPIGIDQPIASGPQNVSAWNRLWWSQEAVHFLGTVFGEDRDFREVLTGRYTVVNGPLAHFYRGPAQGSCCRSERAFGMTAETEPLFDARNIPETIFPSDVHEWRYVPDRGAHAAGLLTMPVFLMKFASRRARAAVLYNAFWCKSFMSGKEPLLPSTEPNLMVRPGCANCHATLEPLAAYFSRIEETEWVFLPEWQFPLKNFNCKVHERGQMAGYCSAFYDPAFSDGAAGLLRGAYASLDHAAAGPIGAAHLFTAAPEFATCAVSRVASSFLGRPTGEDDAALLSSLTSEFVSKGFRMKALVRALLRSPIYRQSNNGGGPAEPPRQTGAATGATP